MSGSSFVGMNSHPSISTSPHRTSKKDLAVEQFIPQLAVSDSRQLFFQGLPVRCTATWFSGRKRLAQPPGDLTGKPVRACFDICQVEPSSSHAFAPRLFLLRSLGYRPINFALAESNVRTYSVECNCSLAKQSVDRSFAYASVID